MRARGGLTRLQLLMRLLAPVGFAAGCLAFYAAAAFAQEPPVVAVLPFRVHSAKPIGYLGESVANLLQEQLGQSGELAVLERSTVREALSLYGGEAPTSDADLRLTAQDLGAGYVVTGSLTELAGRYSLDVRVTPASVGPRPQTQVLTAQNDEELLAGVGELAGRIVEHVLGAVPERVASVELLGAGDMEGRLRGELTTRAGEVYDPRNLRDDLAALRRNPDIGAAEADTELGPDGVTVRFRVAPAARLFQAPRATAGETVAEVRIRGNRRIESDAIRARIATAPGAPYRPDQIATDVKQVYALSFFRNVRVLTERDPRGVVVVFEVEENPVVRQISISGNESIDGDKIRDVLTLTTGTTLDYPLLFENRARIGALYRAQGYYLAEVSYEVETLSESAVGIHFLVEESDKLKLRKIRFVGNEHFSDRELRKDFRTKPWRFWSYATSWFDKSGTYSEPLFIQDLRGIEKLYSDDGFLKVEIGEPQVAASEEGIEVTVDITEGPRFRVGVLSISGDETADLELLRSKLRLKEGEIFNRSQLTEDVTRLRDYYTDRGFFYATVEPLSGMTEGSRVVDVDFNVRKGPLYFIRQVDIAGNTTTVDPVIRRQVSLVEGQLYSQRKVAMARARIQQLGFFEEVDVRVEPTQDPEQLDLEVSVVEKPTGSFSFGAGFSSQDSFLLNGSLSQSNLFGRGYAVTLNADVGKETQRFFFSFRDPAFLGTEFSLGTTIYSTRVRFEDFDQDAIGADLVLGHRLAEDGRSNGFARYSFSSAEIDQGTNVNAASLIFREILQDQVDTSLVGLSFTRDHRNDRLSPTDGYLLSSSLEFAGLGFFSKFMRFEARFKKYFPAPRWIFEQSAFVLGMNFGWAAPFNSISDFDLPEVTVPDEIFEANCNNPNAADFDGEQCRSLDRLDRGLKLPLSERYFLGGIGQFQLRGFKARSVGPRRPVLSLAGAPGESIFLPKGRVVLATGGTECFQLIDEGKPCNNITDKKVSDFARKKDSDVIGGNKFISTNIEYRFPISEAFGLQGIAFFDMGNAFEEGESLWDVRDWRYGTGGAVQWFSPFGPIMLVLGFPIINRVSDLEKSPVFEFSVGGG